MMLVAYVRRHNALTALAFTALLVSACKGNPETQKRRAVTRGDEYLAEKKYGEASIEYLRALQVDSQFAEARYKLAQTYDAAGNTRLAFPEYVKAADLMLEDEDLQVKTGNLLVNGGFFEEAKERARKVLLRNPNNVGALMVLGNALAGLHSLDDAVGVLQQAVRIDPERAGVYGNLGVLQLAKRDAEGAEETFKKAVEVAPRSVDTLTNLGEFYRATGRFEEAKAVFDSALAIDAKNARLNRAIGSLYVNWERPAEAERFFKEAVAISGLPADRFGLSDYYLLIGRTQQALDVLEDLAKDPAQRAAARTRTALLAFADGRRDEAQAIIKEVLDAEPRNGNALVTRARLLLADQHLKEASDAIRTAVTLLPASSEAQLTMGRIELAQHNTEAARKAFNEALRLDPRSLESKLELSELHRNSQQFDTAIQFAEDAIRTDPRNLAARLTLIRALLVRPDDLPRAQREIQAVTTAFPRSARVHGIVGTMALSRNDMQLASAAFRRELDLEPDSIEALAGLTTIDITRRNMQSARARIDAALTNAPSSAELHLLSAKIYRYAGDEARMRNELAKTIELDPSNPEPYGMLGHLLVGQGKLEEAKLQYQETARLRPELVGPPTMLGMLNYVEGNKEEARKWWNEALAIDPDAVAAANNVAWLMAERGTDLDTALQLARRAISKYPDQPEFNDTVGWIYHLKKSPRDAIWYLSHAAEKEPGNALYQFHLGMAYAQKGEDASARRYLQRALALDKDFPEAETVKKTIATLIY